MNLLTVDNLSNLLKLSPHRIRTRARRGEIPGTLRVFGQFRFDAGVINAWLDGNRVKRQGERENHNEQELR